MKLTLLLLLIGSAAALATTEEKLSHRFSVQPGATVVVDVDFGAIDVSTNATSEVVVQVWRKIDQKKKADEELFLRENPVQFTQERGTVTIRSRGKRPWPWSGGPREQNEARYTLTVPAQINARLKTGGGEVQVADLTGEAKVESGGGGLSFARMHGLLDANTGGGSVKAGDCTGRIFLHTGGGGLEVAGGAGSLEARAGGGLLSVRDFSGSAHVSTGGGVCTIERVQGEVEASTGGGPINAVLPAGVADRVKLSTGGGSINVSVPGTAAFNLDAETSGAGVSTDLPVTITGKAQEGRLRGWVNGGGKTVELRSGGGSIHLKKL
jgi:hypothetical protein